MEQLTLFNVDDFSNTTIELKKMIKIIIDSYENEDSWLYCDTETIIELIKMLIIF